MTTLTLRVEQRVLFSQRKIARIVSLYFVFSLHTSREIKHERPFAPALSPPDVTLVLFNYAHPLDGLVPEDDREAEAGGLHQPGG